MTRHTPAEIPAEETPLEVLTGLLRGQRRRWRRWFAGLLTIMVLIGAGQLRNTHIANQAHRAAVTAQSAIALANQQKDEARRAACVSYNQDVVTNVNALNDRVQDLLHAATAASTAPKTAAAQARTDQFLLEQIREFNGIKIPARDCTPAGIAAFYASQGGTLPPPLIGPAGPTTSSTAPPTTTSRPTPTSTTRPAPPTSGTTTTTVYPSSTVPTAPPTTCAVPVTVPGVPCL